jgi:hypothetical protein
MLSRVAVENLAVAVSMIVRLKTFMLKEPT